MMPRIFIRRKVNYNVRLSRIYELPYYFNQLFSLSMYYNFAEVMHQYNVIL